MNTHIRRPSYSIRAGEIEFRDDERRNRSDSIEVEKRRELHGDAPSPMHTTILARPRSLSTSEDIQLPSLTTSMAVSEDDEMDGKH